MRNSICTLIFYVYIHFKNTEKYSCRNFELPTFYGQNFKKIDFFSPKKIDFFQFWSRKIDLRHRVSIWFRERLILWIFWAHARTNRMNYMFRTGNLVKFVWTHVGGLKIWIFHIFFLKSLNLTKVNIFWKFGEIPTNINEDMTDLKWKF